MELINTEVKTDRSCLNIYAFPDENLIKECVDGLNSKLTTHRFRKVGFFSDECDGDIYKYGKLEIAKAQKLTEPLKTLLNMINSIFNSDYNGILINKYENGDFYIERHSDSRNHPENGVLIISYGSTRNFRVFDKITGNKVKDIFLKNNEVLHMYGDFQKEFEHDIEQDKSIKKSRYSLSFHKYNNEGLY